MVPASLPRQFDLLLTIGEACLLLITGLIMASSAADALDIMLCLLV